MPAVSCRCRFPSFLYRVYQPTLRRAEASPRACVASSRARGDGIVFARANRERAGGGKSWVILKSRSDGLRRL